MTCCDPRNEQPLTLEALLADSLTELVMLSDNITVADTAQAFLQARSALERRAASRAVGPNLPAASRPLSESQEL
jgi:hypothetical protein